MNLAELFKHETDLKVLSAGQPLFKEGEQSNAMYVLMSGVVEVTVQGKLMELAEPGAIFGEMAMIEDSSVHSASVIARSDCTFFPVGRERFIFLIQQTPNFALHVMRVMSARLRKTNASL